MTLLARYHNALLAIADGREPCTECGKPHEFVKGTPPTWGSWAATDGHPYRRASAVDVAREALRMDTA